MVSLAPKTPTNVKTPSAPTFKTPGMSLSPQFGGVLKTPTMPSIGATSKTPVQQTGKIVNKSEQLSLFPKGAATIRQPLGIVPPTVDVNNPKPGQQHIPSLALPNKIPDLYHGSPSVFKPGEVIKAGGEKSKEFAYATSSKNVAGVYAHNRGFNRGDEGQGTLWDVIHKVEPANPSNTYVDTTPHGKLTSSYVSRDGFVSKGPVGLIDRRGVMSPLKYGSDFFPPQQNPKNLNQLKEKRKEQFTQGTIPFTQTGA